VWKDEIRQTGCIPPQQHFQPQQSFFAQAASVLCTWPCKEELVCGYANIVGEDKRFIL
jgi:hypothetical protein